MTPKLARLLHVAVIQSKLDYVSSRTQIDGGVLTFNMNVRYRTLLCPSQLRRSKPGMRQTAFLATGGATVDGVEESERV